MAEKPTYEELERRVQELETDYSQLKKELQEAHFFFRRNHAVHE